MICLLPRTIRQTCSKASVLQLSLNNKTTCSKDSLKEVLHSNRRNHSSLLRSKLCGTMAHLSCLTSIHSRMTNNSKSRICSHHRFKLMHSSYKILILMMLGTLLLETTTKVDLTNFNQLLSRTTEEDSSQVSTQICLWTQWTKTHRWWTSSKCTKDNSKWWCNSSNSNSSSSSRCIPTWACRNSSKWTTQACSTIWIWATIRIRITSEASNDQLTKFT